MFSTLHTRHQIENRRRGAIMVKMAVLLPVLIGFMGLTIDGGFLLTTKRQAQNAADAAALAAAMDLMRGHPKETALATANQFVKEENGLSKAMSLVMDTNFHVPPITGPHTGKKGYVEVVVSTPHQSFFMHILTGAESSNVAARAVAGYEAVTAGEGVMVLDPSPPNGAGLAVGGQAVLRVNGRIVVNSAHGGVDEFGAQVVGPNPSPAASAGQPNSPNGIFGTHIDVVGGVDSPDLFKPYNAGDPSPLRCRALPEPDPLLQLPVPTEATGVDPTLRGAVKVTDGGVSAETVKTGGYLDGQNSVASAGQSVAGGLHTTTAGEVILHPGVYDAIEITGGKVYMIPGIYVIAPSKNKGFEITGGTVLGENVMIYNTGSNYNPSDGSPDSSDGEIAPSKNGGVPDGANFAGVKINGSITLTPLDTEALLKKGKTHNQMYSGAKAVSSDFDGMQFYQRRRNRSSVEINGFGDLTGTLYAKWAAFNLAGHGNYKAQFIVGSMQLTGNGDITILAAGDKRGRANNVFLVE